MEPIVWIRVGFISKPEEVASLEFTGVTGASSHVLTTGEESAQDF